MTDEQFSELMGRLKWLQAGQVNIAVRQTEAALVNRLKRPLTAKERDMIRRDCLEEVADIHRLIDEIGF